MKKVTSILTAAICTVAVMQEPALAQESTGPEQQLAVNTSTTTDQQIGLLAATQAQTGIDSATPVALEIIDPADEDSPDTSDQENSAKNSSSSVNDLLSSVVDTIVDFFKAIWNFLFGWIGTKSDADTTVAADPALEKISGKTFIFSSGAGAWSTSSTIRKDGSFTGEFSDSNYDSAYGAKFKGQFRVIEKIDEFTYKLELTDLTITSPTGTVEQREYGSRTIPFTWVDTAYGFDKGTEFYLYLPGKPLAELNDEFKIWVSSYCSLPTDQAGSTFKYYGLYNVQPKYGMCAKP